MSDPVTLTLPTISAELIAFVLAALVAAYEAYTKRTTTTKLATSEATAQQIVDFFDPDTRKTVPSEVVQTIRPSTYLMAEPTKAYLLRGESLADQQSISQQIATNEAVGNIRYTVTYSKGWYVIEYGTIHAGGPFEAPIPTDAPGPAPGQGGAT